MTIRTRIFLVYLLLVGGGLYYMVHWILGGVRPRYLESMEESLVDAATLLASAVETRGVSHGAIDPAEVRQLFNEAYLRQFSAQVYSIQKTNIDLRVYVTDDSGKVVYDSDGGRDEGADYSHWNDVRLTLAGKYGARATRTNPADENSLVIHVAAPIRAGERIVGVLSLGKPTKNINELVGAAQRRIIWAGALGGGLIVLTGFTFSVWLTTPIERLTAYARAVRDGKPATLPRIAGREVGQLRQAFEEMREALEGKKYVERYTQALTHEIKAPLSAVRGAAELLSEDMEPAQRQKFLLNIRTQSERIQHIIDQLLQLSALEARRGLGPTQSFDISAALEDVLKTLTPLMHQREIDVQVRAAKNLTLNGERFLVSLALTNLLKNAIEFSPQGSVLSVSLQSERQGVAFVVEDNGPGIPDFARERIFDRFYSLPRPATGAKSTGLGLSFVQEIAHLHHGAIDVANRETGGCRAKLWLPVG
ncbi:MAG TPA: two-component system sensor histidine kinase CreC [Opitutaceae bacterium]|nr:two-component system sensor histidine kinase CreC [Opitutaceae bacterium]